MPNAGRPTPSIRREVVFSRRAAALLLGSCLACPADALAAISDSLTAKIIAHSQLSDGNLDRLVNVLARARRGESITIGVIGGSITVGAFSSRPKNSYSGRLLAWWKQHFPRCEVRMVNAGVGGTGSMFGALRAQRDLLLEKPDFVIVEFAVNDSWTDGEAFEGLVRQILAEPNQPAVVLLFMMWERGGNDQEMQSKVGAHYHLPMVSFRDALWPEMAAGHLRWTDYIVDTVHPNDEGHAAAARFLTRMCETANAANKLALTDALPDPLYSNAFQFVTWQQAADLDPVDNEGWSRESGEAGVTAWTATQSPGRISFRWSGTGLVAVFAHTPDDFSRMRILIDGAPAQTKDVSEPPKRETIILAHGLDRGSHVVEFENGAALTSRLVGLGSIGVRER